MIKVQDWMASIPDEEKHIAYVGEGKSVRKEFLLCGDGWENYQNSSFYLDMAFDPTTITTHETRQVEQTTLKGKEAEDIGDIYTDETVTKESYTVHNVTVQETALTDIAPLTKLVKEDGIYLTWTVLCQHTRLPGKLCATLRGVGSTADDVKKSAIMVFEVDAAVQATAAATTPISEMEQIRLQASAAKDSATADASQAKQSAADALNCQYICEDRADEVAKMRQEMMTETEALRAEMAVQAQAMQAAREETEYCARTADEHQYTASEHAAMAEQARFAAATNAFSAVEACRQAVSSATEAAQAVETVTETVEQAQTAIGNAVNHCAQYTQRCEQAATDMETAIQAVDNLTYRRVNVRDCGAVGDGVADDRAAIIAAFELAKTMLPCEVYFPAGVYGISNGITVMMDYGTGGLKVCGAGWDVTTIRYLDSYDPDQVGNMWYAIRIWPVGRPDSLPEEADYLHDISFAGLTVHDPDPCAHAWHTAKGDPSNEETHGVDVHCCKGVSVTDCQFITVGDEAIDICFCHDVVVMNNRLMGSPGAGPGGGAISIGDGCKGVVVCGNTVDGSAPDETLENGTIIVKSNNGISVESLLAPVKDVTITGNSVRNVHGTGVKLCSTISGTGLTNVVVADNVIAGCDNGVLLSGVPLKYGIKIQNNLISDCINEGVHAYGINDMTIQGNTLRNVGVGIVAYQSCDTSTQVYTDNYFENVAGCAVWCAGTAVVKNCVFNGVGLTASPAASIPNGAIQKWGGTLTVSGCVLKGVHLSGVKYGIHNADYVEHTDIELLNKTTGEADGSGGAIAGMFTKRIIGGTILGRVEIKADGGIMQGVNLCQTSGAHAVTVAANRVSIIGCVIENNSGTASYKAINETAGYNYNLFANNIVNRAITITGAQSVAVNNVDTRVTA